MLERFSLFCISYLREFDSSESWSWSSLFCLSVSIGVWIWLSSFWRTWVGDGLGIDDEVIGGSIRDWVGLELDFEGLGVWGFEGSKF